MLAGEFALAWHAESQPNPVLAGAGPLLEGKEQRFGVMNSVLFAVATTGTSCGAVNSMHDSFTPLAGLAPMWNLMLGCIVFGGVGAGLYGILMHVLIAVFIAGTDDRAHAGISGQENSGLGRHLGDHCHPGAQHPDSGRFGRCVPARRPAWPAWTIKARMA